MLSGAIIVVMYKVGCLNAELLILGYKYSGTAEQIEREVITNSA